MNPASHIKITPSPLRGEEGAPAPGGGVNLKHKLARRLRNQLTEAEKKLWFELRKKSLLGLRFRRQQPIGSYVVDFISFDINLVIEIDGGQHCENLRDNKRDAYLIAEGFKVLRFWNNDVLDNLEGVLEKISMYIQESHPHLTSPLKGEELVEKRK